MTVNNVTGTLSLAVDSWMAKPISAVFRTAASVYFSMHVG